MSIGPPQSEFFNLEAFDVLSYTTILGVIFGIVFVLYCLGARSLYAQLQEPDKGRNAIFTLGYTSFLVFCTTISLVINSRIIQLAYVDHANYPGGPWGYEAGSYDLTIVPYQIAGIALGLIIEATTMAIQIWRLWIIWSGTPYAVAVTVLPLILLFSYLVLEVLAGIVVEVLPPNWVNIPIPSEAVIIRMDSASFAILSATTILVTGLIVARLLLVRRQHTRVMGSSDALSPYMSVITMLIESYAVDSAWSIASAISRGLDNPSDSMFQGCDPSVKVIAYFLVVYRVSIGRGWTQETGSKLTSLQWNRDQGSTTDGDGGIHSIASVTSTSAAGTRGSQHTSHPNSVV